MSEFVGNSPQGKFRILTHPLHWSDVWGRAERRESQPWRVTVPGATVKVMVEPSIMGRLQST
jgi:hypothetical protein